MKKQENKSVFIIVRETVRVKEGLFELARMAGFNELSDYLRDQWRRWL